MFTQSERSEQKESRASAHALSQRKSVSPDRLPGFTDNRTGSQVQQAVQKAMNPASGGPAVQKEENNTGLPDNLKSGAEQMSGQSLDDVKVHYNSSKPADIQAHAYTQGTDIHVAGGQEQHLPHETWHAVQQKQGRVQPTTQLAGGVPVNDDPKLEEEADLMGGKAAQSKAISEHSGPDLE